MKELAQINTKKEAKGSAASFCPKTGLFPENDPLGEAQEGHDLERKSDSAKLICEFCDKIISNIRNRARHYKRCKMKKQIDSDKLQEQRRIAQLEDKLNAAQQQILDLHNLLHNVGPATINNTTTISPAVSLGTSNNLSLSR